MIRDLFEQKPELKKIILIGLVSVILLIIVITVFSSIKPKKLTYEQIENEMKKAAINYYNSNKDKLPGEGESITITYNTLVEAEKIKPMEKYTKTSCTGNVVIKNNNGEYSYTPYLDCGSSYKTLEFYNKILTDNEIVTDKSGLYVQGDSKVFRGELVNNFVSINNNLWRIVKIDSDNSTKLVLYSGKFRSSWDNRYNSDRKSSVGKNTYTVSRLKETIDSLYKDETFIGSDIKSKLVSKPLCLGARNEEENINNGSIECNETLENEYIGNLSLYEYINASLDTKCVNADTNECQNYNYLVDTESNISWWLQTPIKENSYQAYYVSSYGSINISNCSTNLYVRPTIYLSDNVMYSTGTGTLDDPYIIK